MKLQIEEHRRAQAANPSHDVRPGAGEKLAAHFEPAGNRGELFDELQRRLSRRHVQGNNDGIPHGPTVVATRQRNKPGLQF